MRLQLSSFAWRILNVPVADFTAASSARDNSIRDPKGSKHHGSPSALASLSARRGSQHCPKKPLHVVTGGILGKFL